MVTSFQPRTNRPQETIIMANQETNNDEQQPEEYPPPVHLGKTVCGDVLASRLAQQQLHHRDDHEHDSNSNQHSPVCKAACSLVSGVLAVENNNGEDGDEVVILNHSKKGIIAAKHEEEDGPSRSILEVRLMDMCSSSLHVTCALFSNPQTHYLTT